MKRFTETNKWRDPWFWRLSSKSKLFYLWLLDNCDNAGVVEIDLKLVSSGIGESVEEKHITELGDRLQRISDRKWRIPKFIRFQFGELKPTSIIHRSIIALLKLHNLPECPIIQSHVNPIGMGCQSHQEKEKDKEEEKGTEKEKVPNSTYSPNSRVALHLLNELSGKHFRESESSLAPINARLKESEVTIQGVTQMITRQCRMWKGTRFEEFLRPSTLFAPEKFNEYYAAKDSPIPPNEKHGTTNQNGGSRPVTPVRGSNPVGGF